MSVDDGSGRSNDERFVASSDDDGTLEKFERALGALGTARYDLTLFVAGASALSARAVADVRALCESHLRDRYELQVVDVYRNPDLVTRRGVLASPTLIKDFPLPKRVLVGDLSNVTRVLIALDVEQAPHLESEPTSP